MKNKSKKIKLPPDVYIGKELSNGLMIGGRAVFNATAQIFLHCAGNEKKCHDTIAILPNRNAKLEPNTIIDGISNETAGKIFHLHGWLIKGYNNSNYTRCPICSKKIKLTQKKTVNK